MYHNLTIQTFIIIKNDILILLKDAFISDLLVAFKILLTMEKYNCFIKCDDFLIQTIENSSSEPDYLNDISSIIEIYTKNYGKVFPQSTIDLIFDQSFQANPTERAHIWNILSFLFSNFEYIINVGTVSLIVDNYFELSFSEKQSLFQILRSMLLSSEDQNLLNFSEMYIAKEDLISLLFLDYKEINDLLVIDIILLMKEHKIQLNERCFFEILQNIETEID